MWHSSKHLALLWGKDISTIQKWCKGTFLIECGFKVAQQGSYVSGSRGRGNRRWLIFIPESTERAPADTRLDLSLS